MFRYYETCVCGSTTTLEGVISLAYEWKQQVNDWRENHKHELINRHEPYWNPVDIDHSDPTQVDLDDN